VKKGVDITNFVPLIWGGMALVTVLFVLVLRGDSGSLKTKAPQGFAFGPGGGGNNQPPPGVDPNMFQQNPNNPAFQQNPNNPPQNDAKDPPADQGPFPEAQELKKLFETILTHYRNGENAKAQELLANFNVPEGSGWFQKVFGQAVGTAAATKNKQNPPSMTIVANLPNDAKNFDADTVEASRMEDANDPKASGITKRIFGLMVVRVPLYRVRIFNAATQRGSEWSGIAYADKGFRFLGISVTQ
jgi:hypothetical protein